MEVGFSSTFLSQLHGLTLANREAEREPHSSGRLEQKLRRLNLHIVEDEQLMRSLNAGSKLNTHPSFLRALRDSGPLQAELWLDRHHPRATSRTHLSRFLPDHPTIHPV